MEIHGTLVTWVGGGGGEFQSLRPVLSTLVDKGKGVSGATCWVPSSYLALFFYKRADAVESQCILAECVRWRSSSAVDMKED